MKRPCLPLSATLLLIFSLCALVLGPPALFAADESSTDKTPTVHTDVIEDTSQELIPLLGLAPSLASLLNAQISITCDPTAGFEDNCEDGIDNDCDGCVDYNDSDCGVIGCSVCTNGVVTACCARGQPCQIGTECCSGFCRGKPGGKTCR